MMKKKLAKRHAKKNNQITLKYFSRNKRCSNVRSRLCKTIWQSCLMAGLLHWSRCRSRERRATSFSWRATRLHRGRIRSCSKLKYMTMSIAKLSMPFRRPNGYFMTRLAHNGKILKVWSWSLVTTSKTLWRKSKNKRMLIWSIGRMTRLKRT